MDVATGDDAGRALVAQLHAAGAVPAAWVLAFQAVARELFIPDRVWVTDGGARADPVALDRATDPERWLASVYSDVTIVTQFDDGRTPWPQPGHRPTSSSSMPSVVAKMLRALEVEPGGSVLEIGTGTGYNAALLAELVGPRGHVTTVEIDPALAARARRSLTAAGYSDKVRVLTADGAADLDNRPGGVHAPGWDRVIATAGVHVGRLPYGWVRHTRPGGIVLAPMRADLAVGPLVRFVVDGDGTARGRAVPEPKVSFMELRTHRVPMAALDELRWDDEPADVTFTDRAPWELLLNAGCRWAVAIALPSCRYGMWEPNKERNHRLVLLQDPLSGSWASVVPSGDRFLVRQAGPDRKSVV